MLDNTSQEQSAKSVSRRSILKKAGWALPVIAATPLLNTASAMSAVNCAGLQDKLSKHVNNGDYEAANDILVKIIDNGCTL
ncbi:MAG: hypothetical protein AB8G77_09620 [Rhodothermales bacterium]